MNYSVSVFKMREDNYGYLIYNEDTALCVDPFDYQLIYLALQKELKELKIYDKKNLEEERNLEKRRRLLFCLNTHHHYDHSGGNNGLFSLLGNEFQLVTDKDISLPGLQIKVIKTPCHTKDSVCFYLLTGKKYLFTGDTIFYLGCGKFFEGNEFDMFDSLKNVVNMVDKDTLLLYGHDYNEKNCEFVESVMNISVPDKIKREKFLCLKDELIYNPYLLALSKSANEIKIIRGKKDIFGLGSK